MSSPRWISTGADTGRPSEALVGSPGCSPVGPDGGSPRDAPSSTPEPAAAGPPATAAKPPGPPALPKEAVATLPRYRPGRSASQAAAEHGLARAVKLASNELPWGPLPSVAAALADSSQRVNRYPDHTAGRLRQRIAEGLGIRAEEVAVGAGAIGLLQQLALAYAGPGSEVLYGLPSFEAYPIFARLVGAEGKGVPLRGCTPSALALAGALCERTRLVLLDNPNNPLGTAMPGEDLLWLARQLPPQCLLVVDEAYREFVTDPRVPSALPLVARHPQVVVLRTFSKAHGLAGLRVGYAIAHPEVVAALHKTLLPFAVTSLAQRAAMASLDAGEELDRRVAAVVSERRRVTAVLREAGWEVPPSEANFVWLPAGPATAGLALELERRGVVVRAFEDLGVRVTIGSPEDNDLFLSAILGVSRALRCDALGRPEGSASSMGSR